MGAKGGAVSYREWLYDSYVETHVGHTRDLWRAGIERQAQAFQHYFGRHLPKDRKARVLDVGCGYGAFLHYLRARGYVNSEGVDVSPQQVEEARRLGVGGIVCQDVESFLRARPGTYDCIVAIDFLDHFPKGQVLEVLKLFHDALKPQGRLLLQVVNGAGPFAGRLRYGDFTHEFALTPTSAGQVLRVCDTAPYVHGLRSLLRWVI